MARKHLRELLKEDQEPFVLVDYIKGRRLQHRRRKPLSSASNFAEKFRKNSCFFTEKSPLCEFPDRSPCAKTAPPKTVPLLLEATMRIQKFQNQLRDPNSEIGFFGSILKRMMIGKRSRKRGISVEMIPVSVKDVLRWDFPYRDEDFSDMGVPCSCSSSPWTESNEEKWMDLESLSSRSLEFEEREFVKERGEEDFQFDDDRFCGSRLLPGSSASICRTPELSSPARTAGGRKTEVSHGRSDDGSIKGAEKDGEDDKEKRQFSPVSVLDAPFEDDCDEHEEEDEDEEDFQQTFASLQRARLVLLDKISRFQRLVELDPLELEKILSEEEAEEHDVNHGVLDKAVESEPGDTDDIMEDRVPKDLRRLVSDLIEEEKELGSDGMGEIVKRVWRKIDSWKEVDLDMMVALDINRWKKSSEEVEEVGFVIELGIFSFLVEELSADLVHLGYDH